MVLLACKCLNIKLHAKGSETDHASAKEQNLSEDYIPTGFFPSGEVEIELDLRGIVQEHKFLVHRRNLGNYTVFRCLNCELDSYALPKDGIPVLVNNQLQYEASVIERVKNSPEYSPLFQMVLMNRDGQFAGSMPDPNSRSYESLQSNLNSIQQQLSEFLIQEEENMEHRIRNFEEQQKADFSELQTKLKEEKKKMISLLLMSAEYGELASSGSSKGSTNRSQESSSAKKKAPVTRMKSLPQRPRPTSDQDELFSFDGLSEDTDEPFYKDDDASDDDNDSEDDAFVETNTRLRPGQSQMLSQPIYSSSVPIAVPMWQQGKSDAWDDTESTPTGPDQIAASMQAMAQSITDDNRYIFGDRPRPRLNTGDFTR